MTSNDVILWSHDHPKTAIYFNCCIFKVIFNNIIDNSSLYANFATCTVPTCTSMPQGGFNDFLIYIKHLFP